MGDIERFSLDLQDFGAFSTGEKLDLKKKSFTVNPDVYDLTYMSKANPRDLPDWMRQNNGMRFNYLDKLMLTKMMFKDVQSKYKANPTRQRLTFSPHQVANYAYYKLRK